MPYPDIPAAIEIRPSADNWGPFSVALTDKAGVSGLPDGETISDASIRVYEGRMVAGTDLSTLTDAASNLIENVTFSGQTVSFEVMYPSSPAGYRGKIYTLFIDVTTTPGARENTFVLYYLKVW